jgi:hypothetical protein
MNCYDCATDDSAIPAVAICHDCGAGVCPDHAVTSAHHLTRMVPLGLFVPIEPAARIVRCTTCATAVTAARSPDAGRSDTTPAPTRSRWRHHAVH